MEASHGNGDQIKIFQNFTEKTSKTTVNKKKGKKAKKNGRQKQISNTIKKMIESESNSSLSFQMEVKEQEDLLTSKT